MGAAGIEEEKPPRVLPGVQQAFHLRVHDDAAARVAGADEMRVAVPDLRRVEALPGTLHQLVRGEPRRQGREAGVPQPLVRPEAPRGKRADAGESGARAEKKTASFQKTLRRANS